jgi:hypothetical protein
VITKRLLTSHRRPLVAQLLLALALLVAQGVAQAHLYSHFATVTEKSDFNGTAGQLCSECLASAPLLSAAGTPASPCITFVADAVTVVAALIAPSFESSHHYAFRSRAPPELL